MRRTWKIATGVFTAAFFIFLSSTPALARTDVSGTLTTSTTWTAIGSPYVVSYLSINSGVTLTINPGVVVKFAVAYPNNLLIRGRLVVNGTPDNKVYFTSYYDDAVGGDTNGDGSGQVTGPGQWGNIDFESGSSASINSAVFRYGGYTYNGCYGNCRQANIYNNGGNISLAYVQLATSSLYGLLQASGTSTFSNSEFNNQPNGLYITNGSVAASSSSFHHNTTAGVAAYSGNLVLTGNSFVTNNKVSQISAENNFVHSNNTASGNSVNGFSINNSLTSNQTWNKDLPYVVNGLNILAGKTLAIDPGVIVKFAVAYSPSLVVNGNLRVNGTPDDRVYFTSFYDDAVGGDTNGDGSGQAPGPGQWGNITFNAGSGATINSAIIHYGGYTYGGCQTCYFTTIRNNGGSLNFSDVHISSSSVYGLFQGSGVSIVTSSEFYHHNFGVYIQGGTTTISGSSFHDNVYHAVYNSSGNVIDARNNWWGDDSGPRVASNPGGKGQTFLGNVLYDPWIGKVTNHAPSLSYSTSFPNGISTSTIFLPSQPTFKIIYSDQDNDVPTKINVIVNSTTYPMSLVGLPTYASGTPYTFAAPTGTFAKGDFSFYFVASDGKVTTTSQILNFKVRNVPVILVPGILGTELKRGTETLWLDLLKTLYTIGDEFMDPLAMNHDGSAIDNSVAPYDVVRKKYLGVIPVFDYFDGLVNQLTLAGYNQNTDLFVFPYDWRIDNTYTAQRLGDKIESVLNQTDSNRVNLVAHSMGGLVAKQYIAVSGTSKINKLVFIGTPHLGSPDSAKTLLFGGNLGIEFVFSFLNELEIKSIARNMTSIYQLLPSPAYFAKLGGYFYDLVSKSVSVFDYENTISYLKGWDTNQNMLDQAAGFHSSLDNLDLSRIKTYNISGCKTATLTKIIRRNTEADGNEYYLQMQTGDGTVPLGSADLADSIGVENYYIKNVVHSKMPSLDNVRQLVTEIIGDNVNSSSLPVDVQTTKSGCGVNGKIVSVHSPVDLNVYDATGNHVGPTENGGVELNIPGATYENIANNKFIFLPEDQNQTYTVKLDATATGTFSFRVENIVADQPQQTVYYNDISIVPQSQGQIEISASSTDTSLEFDANGTGTFVPLTADSVLGAGESEDYIKPTTTISVTGVVGNNGWYLSTTTISLSAIDDNSGILKTEYSLDNGNTWQIYSVPFAIAQQGTSTVKYKSIDRAGNKEAPQQTVFLIDSEYPEATIIFDPVKKDIVITGEDNLTPVVVTDLGNKFVLMDEAGNSTTLNFVEKNRRDLSRVNLLNILYNGVEFKTLDMNRFQFNWSNPKQGILNELQQGIYSDGILKLRASYNAKQNLTIIHEVNSGSDTVDEKLNGLILIRIKTNKGDLNYNF